MSEEQTRLKVKDLPESEQKELLQEMEAAGLQGIKIEYKVETAKAKIKEWKERTQQAGKTNESEQTIQEVNTNGEDVNKPAESVNKTPENVNGTTKTLNKTTKEVKNPAKKLICHICYGEVINGVCTKCGYTLKRA